MSEPLSGFTLARPDSVQQAVAMLAENPAARPFAGGTDLLVNMRRGLEGAQTLVDLGAIGGFGEIALDGDTLRIGAGATLAALGAHRDIGDGFPAISQAARAVAGPAHREAATLGGNLCLDTRCLYYNQSHWWRHSNGFCLKYRGDICHVAPKGNRCRAAFSGDLAPALMVHGASTEIAGPDGTRHLPLADLYREDGAAHLAMARDEILVSVSVPRDGAASCYEKIRVRGAIDFPLAGVAVALAGDDAAGTRRLSVAVTGTNSCPVLIDTPPLGRDGDTQTFLAALEKRVLKGVSPQRTTTIAPHYRRLSAAAVTVRLARRLI